MNFIKKCFLSLGVVAAPFAQGGLEARSQEQVSRQESVASVIVLGGGVGALTSALYLARSGVQPIVLEGASPGGLLIQSHSVQNWPGELEIQGSQLTDRMRQQAVKNGARLLQEEVIGVDFSQKPFQIKVRSLDGSARERTLFAHSCVVAMGTEPNFLHIPGESTYWGKGVTNCATCDGNLYQNQIVGVVGGGDAAVLEALYLAKIAKEVHVFVRKETLRAYEKNRVQSLLEQPNISIHYQTEVQSVQGDGNQVTGVLLKTQKEEKPFALNGLFLAIGSTPNTTLFQGELELDSRGYIVLTKDQQTSVQGVYAIGDIVDPVYKQAISAAGDGAKAALQAQQYLSDHSLQGAAWVEGREGVSQKSPVIEITSKAQFDRELSESVTPVLVDFYATWCGPCKQIAPLLEVAASQLEGKVKVLKVDVEQFPSLVSLYQIRAMPTFLLLQPSGKVIDRKVGREEISTLLKDLERQPLAPTPQES